MSTIRTRAITKAKTGRKQHHWLQKEYIVAIYMALHSKENMVGIYNIDQCAFIIGVPSNSMKIMADNFRAYVGRTRLGTQSPRMEKAITKYKEFPEEQLRKLAVDYIEKTWNRQRGLINVERHINSIGRTTFVEYYDIFKAATADSDNQKEYLEKLSEKWTLKAKRTRLAKAINIFRCKCEKKALEMIIQSKKLEENTIEKAKMLLNKHFSDSE